MMQYSQWNGFRGGEWQRAIDVRSFIQKNYTLYEGDDSFLVPPTDRTRRVWEKCEKPERPCGCGMSWCRV